MKKKDLEDLWIDIHLHSPRELALRRAWRRGGKFTHWSMILFALVQWLIVILICVAAYRSAP